MDIMDHIRQFNWSYNNRESEYFLTDHDLDNSATERILRGKFKDPLLSSESEDENHRPTINWEEIINGSKNNKKTPKIFTPGMKGIPGYPKLSALNTEQHYQCLKVLAAENPLVNEKHIYPRPTRLDHRIFADIKPIYEKEQKEYLEWAKKLWTAEQCIRVLRPRPSVEHIYEVEFNLRTSVLSSLPKYYELAAQIPLESVSNKFSFVHQKDLIMVDPSTLPTMRAMSFENNYTILNNKPQSPSVCKRHPCRFVLPGEKSMSCLPLTELNEELAQYASANDAQFILSESALKCITEHKKSWLLPISVQEVIGLDGDARSVYVIGSEFSTRRRPAGLRTYAAFKHMLYLSLVRPEERKKVEDHLNGSGKDDDDGDLVISEMDSGKNDDFPDDTHSDCEGELFIDFDIEDEESNDKQKGKATKLDLSDIVAKPVDSVPCTCKESPPRRSYRRWQVRNDINCEKINVIVHCAHKARNLDSEVIFEPIPEYQLDLGGTMLPAEKIRSLALSLYLRRNATLMNVRVDGQSGDIVAYDFTDLQDLEARNDNRLISEISNIAFTTLNQLQGLLPGNYVLQHESEHGANALLYVARSVSTGLKSLSLDAAPTQLADEDEAPFLKTPPTLAPVLLPYHKTRRILPLAFSPFQNHVAKGPKKPLVKQKVPPPALKWPKRRRKRKHRDNTQ